MTARGKLIVIEGIDGSGKRTQIEMLAQTFEQRAIPYIHVNFPNYEGFFGNLVAKFLNGEFGTLGEVDPHFSALLYAGDRLESKPKIETALAAGKNVLADRYVGSNLAHQGARVEPDKRPEFMDWLRELEYRVYGLPAEDLVIYLRVPVDEAHRLIGEKSKRGYTKLRHDIQERNRNHLETASWVYEHLAHQANWVRVDCMSGGAGSLRTPAEIHSDVLAAIDERLLAPTVDGR